MSFEEIVALEPRIGALLNEARGQVLRRPEEKNGLYARYKALLGRMVGWCAPNEKLRESVHYETVIGALCEALGY